jgi:hypothetical protein
MYKKKKKQVSFEIRVSGRRKDELGERRKFSLVLTYYELTSQYLKCLKLFRFFKLENCFSQL